MRNHKYILTIAFVGAFSVAFASGLPSNGLQAHFRADHTDAIKASTGFLCQGATVTNWITESDVGLSLSLVQHESYGCPHWQTNAFTRSDGVPRPAVRFRRNSDNTADVATICRLVSSVRTSVNMESASTWFLVMNNLAENKQSAVFGFAGGEAAGTTNRFGAFFIGSGPLRLHNNSNPGSSGNINVAGGSANLIDSRGDGGRMTSGLNGSEQVNIAQTAYDRPGDQSLYLGRFPGVDDSAAFDCAELAIYNRALNDAEMRIARNALAVRWGLSIQDSLWAGAALGFCEDLAGIGSATSTGNGRMPGVVEQSEKTGGLFLSVPEDSLAGQDGYILVANNGNAAKLLLDGGSSLLARVWRVESTLSSVPPVTFAFDLSDLGFLPDGFTGRLYRRADGNSSFVDTGVSGTLSDGVYSFTFAVGTDISGEYALSVGDDATAIPCAGVAGNLQGWFRADTGVATANGVVSKWRNLGLTGDAGDLAEVTGSPEISTTAFSEKSVHFDGSAALSTSGNTKWGVTMDNTWFAVFKVPVANLQNVGVFGSSDPTIRFGAFFTGSSDLRGHAYVLNDPKEFCVVGGADVKADALMLLESCRSGNYIELSMDGVHKDGKATTQSAAAAKFMIGNMATVAKKLSGDVAEIRIYNRALSDAERNIALNHLAARYGVTMSGRVLYGGADYGCRLDVVGVGCTTADGRGDDRVVHVSGIVETSEDSSGLTLAATALSDGDYVLAGHGEKSNAWVRAGTGIKRMKRYWHITKTNASSAGLTLRFSIAAAGLSPLDAKAKPKYALMRSSGDGAWEVVDANVKVEGGDVFAAELPSLYRDGLYTLGARCAYEGMMIILR